MKMRAAEPTCITINNNNENHATIANSSSPSTTSPTQERELRQFPVRKRKIALILSLVMAYAVFASSAALLYDWKEVDDALAASNCKNTSIKYGFIDDTTTYKSVYSYQCLRARSLVIASFFGITAGIVQFAAFVVALLGIRLKWKIWRNLHYPVCAAALIGFKLGYFQHDTKLGVEEWGVTLTKKVFVIIVGLDTLFAFSVYLMFEPCDVSFYDCNGKKPIWRNRRAAFRGDR